MYGCMQVCVDVCIKEYSLGKKRNGVNRLRRSGR
jgi:hypothetical protein